MDAKERVCHCLKCLHSVLYFLILLCSQCQKNANKSTESELSIECDTSNTSSDKDMPPCTRVPRLPVVRKCAPAGGGIRWDEMVKKGWVKSCSNNSASNNSKEETITKRSTNSGSQDQEATLSSMTSDDNSGSNKRTVTASDLGNPEIEATNKGESEVVAELEAASESEMKEGAKLEAASESEKKEASKLEAEAESASASASDKY